MTLNLRFRRVPDPDRADPVKAPMIRWPELLAFDVMDIAELSVPNESKAGDAGVTTVGSKVICRSYENAPKPVRLPTVIGTRITPPGVGVRFGSDTATPVREGATSVVTKGPAGDVETEGSGRGRSRLLDMPAISKAEERNLDPKPPAANAATLNSKARTITANVMSRNLFTEKDLFPTDI
jgi:hypothetical protein